ncbi:MAG: MFS transporter [Chitinophagia bacterium]|nr:MFS transporter [Chitinophagia bacterium]
MNEANADFVSRKAIIGVVVAALGFFVDLYDIIIFSAERIDSFRDLQISEDTWPLHTRNILNAQMLGMLIGGFLWGTIGDKFGRLKVLFGSILMYSLFTFINAYVRDVNSYMWCRFLAGVGLAGELGAGITLVSEQISGKYRGFAVALVGGIGMFGAVTAGIVATFFSWKTSFIIGGLLGILLLLLRFSVAESGLFAHMANHSVTKGNFLIVLRNKKRSWKFFCVLLVGMPGWFATGILITFTKEVAASMGMTNLPVAATVISLNFLGFALGDPLCGLLSQYLKSRKKAIFTFLASYSLFLALFFLFARNSVTLYYLFFTMMGLSVGFTIMLLTLTAEQFGTNIRTLVTSFALNLIRGWVIPLSFAFQWVAGLLNGNYYYSAIIIASVALVFAFFALTQLEETYQKNLDFYE